MCAAGPVQRQNGITASRSTCSRFILTLFPHKQQERGNEQHKGRGRPCLDLLFFFIFPVCAQTCLLDEQKGVPARSAATVTHFLKEHSSSPAPVHSKRARSLLPMAFVVGNLPAHLFIVFFPMCACPRWFSFSAVSSAASRYRLYAPVFTRPAFVYVVLNRP